VTDLPILRGCIALAKTWRGRFILVMVASQLLLPLRYYIRHRDPHDERFAWRMFSPMRMSHCKPTFLIDGKPLALDSVFHEAWRETAERGRFTVVEAMGAELCHQHPGSAVKVSLECTYLDRDPATWGGFDICTIPQL
jgi:hypothetical protein